MNNNSNNNKFKKGSEWRKWDLHAHTPLDYEWKNKPNVDISNVKKFKEEAEKFAKDYIQFAKKENLSVLAIVDHNFCNDLKQSYLPYIINEAKQNNITILPGFEITVKDGSGIHLLVIFKEGTELQKIYNITKSCFNPNETLVPNNGQVPISNKSIDELKNLLDKSNEDYLLIFAHADRENGVLDKNTIHGDRRVQEWQKKFINIAQLSKSTDKFSQDNFIKKVINKNNSHYARDITYIIASDCRSIDKNNKQKDRTYLGKKFCWIKADPTFEGLKQIIYEPEERVKIQESNPNESKKHWKLISIEISESTIPLLPNQKIEFNHSLVSIIGGRGTGKTTLLDLIFLINSCEKYKSSIVDGFCDNKADLNIKYIFSDKDGKKYEYKFKLSEYKKQCEKLPIYYLTQKQIESFSQDREKVRKKFLKVLGIEDSDIYFQDEIRKADNFISELKQLNNEEEGLISKIKKEYDYNGDDNGIKKINGWVDERVKSLEKEKEKYFTEETAMLIKKLSNIKNKTLYLKDIKDSSKHSSLISSVKLLNRSIKEYNLLFEKDNKKIHKDIAETPIYDVDKLQEIIKKNKNIIESILIELQKEHLKVFNKLKELGIEDPNNISKVIDKNNQEIFKLHQLQKRVSEINDRRKEIFRELIKLLEKYKNNISSAQNDIKNKFNEFIEDRGELFESIFNGVSVSGEIYFKNRKLRKDFKELFYKDKASFVDKYFPSSLNWEGFFGLVNVGFVKELFEQYKNGYFRKDNDGYYSFLKNIFVNLGKYIKVYPAIFLNNAELDNMSGGQQATLLLKLELATNGIIKDIILLDQPENHLDNNFINKYLVAMLKKLKTKKQVIIASHNANIVVHSDSEEVIIAKMDDKSNKEYFSGAIENNFVMDGIIDILEGGKTALENRMKKYNYRY